MTKKLILLSGLILTSLGITACQNKENDQSTTTNSSQVSKSSKSVLPALGKETDSKTSGSVDAKVSDSEWMLMGYLVYKNKDIDDLDKTISMITSDFDKNNLTATKQGKDNYRLSNQYGSVDVKVSADKVVVTNDGVTETSKKSLRKIFAGKMKLVNAMTKNIQNSSTQVKNNEESSWKKGIPEELIGEYTTVKPGSQQGVENAAIIDIRSNGITTWTSGMPTSYDYNVQYYKEGNKYFFKFDSILEGGSLSNGKKQEKATGQTLTLEKDGTTYQSDYTQQELYQQAKMTLAANPSNEN